MPSSDVHRLALEKVGRILGRPRAEALLAGYLSLHRKERLVTTGDLHSFGESLGAFGAVEQAVGALLMVQAVLIETSEPHG